jgi:putative transposase
MIRPSPQKRYLDPQTAAPLLGIDERSVRRLCESGKLSRSKQVDGKWCIPADSDPRFKPYLAIGDRIDERFLSVPPDKKNEALRRVGLISEFETYSGQIVRNNGLRTVAMQAFCLEKDISFGTFKRWLKRYRDGGIMALVDSRGGSPADLEIISAEAFDFFKTVYLTQKRLSVRVCLQVLEQENRQRNHGWIVPEYYALCRYVEKSIPVPAKVLLREGRAAYDAKCAPYVIVDQDSVQPGQVWVGDHHEFNCWVRHRNEWIRPWITAWEDYRSRKIVGWHISTSPNSTTILFATKVGIEQHGAPESVKIDNGRDYDSQLFTGQTKSQRKASILNDDDQSVISGIYAMLGIGVSFSIPYHPQSKKIERFFDTLDCQFSKTLPTYCGKDTTRRPEGLFDYLKTEKAVADAYNLETFSALVDRYLAIYNASAHTGEGMDGRSPDQVFALQPARRVVAKETLEILMRVWSPILKVGKNGVNFRGFWYGQYNTILHSWFGREVRVSFDPDDVRTVCVHDAETYKLITIAEQAALMPFGAINEGHLREAMKMKGRATKAVKRHRQDSKIAATSLTDLALSAKASEALETAPEKPGNVKPVRTPLDGQAKEFLRQKNQQVLKRAVGAECETTMPFGKAWQEEVDWQNQEFQRMKREEKERLPKLTFSDE